MNHILKLQDDKARLQARLDFINDEVTALRVYLMSDKFSGILDNPNDLDGYVNVNDVLNRLQGVY